MVVKPFSCTSARSRFSTAWMMSLSLADTGRFDEDAVRMELLYDLFQSLAEITDQTAADAAEFISLISTPESLRKPPSMPIAELFSISTTCSPLLYASLDQLLDQRRLAGSKNLKKISTFII